MSEWQSISHVSWYCRYRVIIVPKYRKKVILGTLRKAIGGILRQLCDQEGGNWSRGMPWGIMCTCV